MVPNTKINVAQNYYTRANPYGFVSRYWFIWSVLDLTRTKTLQGFFKTKTLRHATTIPQQADCFEARPFLHPCSNPWNQTYCGGRRQASQGPSRLRRKDIRMGTNLKAMLQAQLFLLCYWPKSPVGGRCPKAFVWHDIDTPRATLSADQQPP